MNGLSMSPPCWGRFLSEPSLEQWRNNHLRVQLAYTKGEV